jgi:hypothetical protein
LSPSASDIAKSYERTIPETWDDQFFSGVVDGAPAALWKSGTSTWWHGESSKQWLMRGATAARWALVLEANGFKTCGDDDRDDEIQRTEKWFYLELSNIHDA